MNAKINAPHGFAILQFVWISTNKKVKVQGFGNPAFNRKEKSESARTRINLY